MYQYLKKLPKLFDMQSFTNTGCIIALHNFFQYEILINFQSLALRGHELVLYIFKLQKSKFYSGPHVCSQSGGMEDNSQGMDWNPPKSVPYVGEADSE